MAGAVNSPSRLGVTLQGYDQVIALSQGNINESLEYYFSAKPDLCKFNASLKTGAREFLKGTLKPPTIELVDVENADQALYVLEFESGEYGYYDFDSDPPARATKSAKNWKLAFYVDFSLKKMATVPKSIQDVVNKPGSYSVEQLLVNFGTADLLSFNWDRSKIIGFAKPGDEIDVRATIKLFVGKWLEGLKAIDGTERHNVLGYAVKVDPNKAKDFAPAAPSFPPTAVRLQTINYRPNGDEKQAKTDHPHNAFLFTEMTDGRDMIVKDLAYSGDFFFGSIGGTMVMSRRIFWEKFLQPKLSQICDKNQGLAFDVTEAWAQKIQRDSGLSSYSSSSVKTSWVPVGFGCWRETTLNMNVGSGSRTENCSFKIKDTMQPSIGSNTVVIQHEVSRSHESKDGVQMGSSSVTIKWKTTIALKSVDNSGKLTAAIVPVEKAPGEKEPTPDDIAFAARTAQSLLGKSSLDLTKDIEDALNGQGRFIFPGGGDFDMKDPIFNNAGDLMIGLTYKKGELGTGTK